MHVEQITVARCRLPRWLAASVQQKRRQLASTTLFMDHVDQGACVAGHKDQGWNGICSGTASPSARGSVAPKFTPLCWLCWTALPRPMFCE
jgi:hypothetical protein